MAFSVHATPHVSPHVTPHVTPHVGYTPHVPFILFMPHGSHTEVRSQRVCETSQEKCDDTGAYVVLGLIAFFLVFSWWAISRNV